MSDQEEKPRVLFVDDDVTVREHLAQQLARDYVVETAENGEQAMRAVLRDGPDLIVCASRRGEEGDQDA